MDDVTLRTLRKYRRDLHKIPELGYNLPRTTAYVKNVLKQLPGSPPVFAPCESTICCFFDRGKPKTMAIRACMDGLPIPEHTGYAFASVISGQMHACGHDGDMAIALCLAQYLATHAGKPERNILIIFQPAEETYSGERESGAQKLHKKSMFQVLNVDLLVATRLWHEFTEGRIVVGANIRLAASKEVNVTFEGVSGHMTTADGDTNAKSAVGAAVDYYECSKQMQVEANRNRYYNRWLLNFGYFNGGNVRNQTGVVASLEGSLRAPDNKTLEIAKEELNRLLKRVEDKHGVTGRIDYSEGYPPVENSLCFIKKLEKASVPGIEFSNENKVLALSDDFSWYQKNSSIKAVYFLLGTGPTDTRKTRFKSYSSEFQFDETALEGGLNVYKYICTHLL